jgi:hypothetical protein
MHREKDPHVHVGDELLVFVGLHPKQPNYLGATIDMYTGKEIITKEVDKTYAFFLIRTDTGGPSGGATPATLKTTPEGYPIQ